MIYLTLYGNLGGDAEEKTAKNGGKFTAFSVAVDLGHERKQWVSCNMSYPPKNMANLKRGAQVFVVGSYSKIYPGKPDEPLLQMRCHNVQIMRHARSDGTGLHRELEKQRSGPALNYLSAQSADRHESENLENSDLPF